MKSNLKSTDLLYTSSQFCVKTKIITEANLQILNLSQIHFRGQHHPWLCIGL